MHNERDAGEVVLLPCPFCGGVAVVVNHRAYKSVECQVCYAEVQGQEIGDVEASELGETAAAAWNKRATRPPAPEDAGTVERETYRQMHDIATNDLGCASILEALEEIDRFRNALTTIADGVLDARGNKRPLLAKFSQTLALAALSRLDGDGA